MASPRLVKLGQLLDEWRVEAEAAHDALVNKKPRGPITNLPTLDRELGGALAPGLHVLHAGPGVGKTAFALQVAATSPFPALYISAEMGLLELFRRHTARVTGTFLGKLRTGEIPPDESLRLAKHAAAAAPLLHLVDATQAWAEPDWIQQAVELIRGTERHALLVVDSVHSWVESAGDDLDEYSALGAGLASLRKIARALNCPVLAIGERNRAKMDVGGISAAAGSRKFEFGAESVWALDRKKDDAMAGEVPVTLTIEKNRNGSPGRRINLLFRGALQQFTEAAAQ